MYRKLSCNAASSAATLKEHLRNLHRLPEITISVQHTASKNFDRHIVERVARSALLCGPYASGVKESRSTKHKLPPSSSSFWLSTRVHFVSKPFGWHSILSLDLQKFTTSFKDSKVNLVMTTHQLEDNAVVTGLGKTLVRQNGTRCDNKLRLDANTRPKDARFADRPVDTRPVADRRAPPDDRADHHCMIADARVFQDDALQNSGARPYSCTGSNLFNKLKHN